MKVRSSSVKDDAHTAASTAAASKKDVDFNHCPVAGRSHVLHIQHHMAQRIHINSHRLLLR